VSRAPTSTSVVARFHYRHEAELAQGYLEDAGVPTALFIDDAGGMDVGMAFVNPARLVVRLEDEQRAREVLADIGMLSDGEAPHDESDSGGSGTDPETDLQEEKI